MGREILSGIIAIVFIIAVIFSILYCSGLFSRKDSDPPEKSLKAIIRFDGTGDPIFMDISSYTHMSGSWIEITNKDGVVYKTDTKNVIIIEKKEPEK